ncbi:CBS domain-containing protein [Chloroflexota bacterium]
MKIRDLLERKLFKYRNVVTVGPNDTISTAVNSFVEQDMGSLPVCNDEDKLVGIITERDIVRKCAISDGCTNIKIQDVMSQEVTTGSLEDDVDYAISIMKERRIRHLPIVHNEVVVGMISMRDLLLLHLVSV